MLTRSFAYGRRPSSFRGLTILRPLPDDLAVANVSLDSVTGMANPRLPDSEQVIASFVEQYENRFDFYSDIAGKASQLRETALKQEDVRATSSFRAKNSAPLKTKLPQLLAWRRERGNGYAGEAAISNDLVDLAGVRISLYFLDDRAQVESIIIQTFEIVAKKRLGGYKESVLGMGPSLRDIVPTSIKSGYGTNVCTVQH
jgi:hypothetical protein